MNTIKNGLKGASIFLIMILLILASVVVTANKENIIQDSYKNYNGTSREDIYWDNNMSFKGLIRAQYDSVLPMDAYPADDFQFNLDTYIKDVHWIGGYWFGDYQHGDFNWSILFYSDRGDGNAPGNIFAGPFNFNSSEITKIFIWDTGSFNFYKLSVDLPNFIKFTAGNKYWISIWGVGLQYPCSGWAFHDKSILLHKALIKSFYYLNDSDWHDIEDLGDPIKDPVDLCFQLTGIVDEPPEPPIIDGPIKGKVGIIYPFNFTSIDPDGDQVSYYIEWGDGTTTDWTDLQSSGVPYIENHTWDIKGTYTITCKSKDEHGLESNLTSFQVTIPRNKELINNKNYDLIKTSGQPRGKYISILRGWATGNATSGKSIGFRGTIAKINFVYLKMEWYQIFPPRWQMISFNNVTAIFFNVNQTIPIGPFEFENDWVIAIVFQ